ncbi:hypothetical protein SAMN05216188_12356 [Lentzea xinjiangensis]|uniref:Uncharacterized protein n=1 Tax=Lentzea xinjiangensis TaxID=402600 RepID=A0A1H9UZU0_9PSEU|nr:hypothetical protein [Lentzea xinjiangensis]SES14831.1 hypothetical protein SAMN05216188_12356 [Lentzea xinjiangensis]
MTSSHDATARATVRLNALILRGFQFLYPRDHRGELAAVVGVRAHDNVIDIVRLHDENDAIATRMPADEVNVLVPTRYSWQRTGPACRVIEELLELPDDRIA